MPVAFLDGNDEDFDLLEDFPVDTQNVTAFGYRTVLTGLGDDTDIRGNRLRVDLGDLATRIARLRRGAAE